MKKLFKTLLIAILTIGITVGITLQIFAQSKHKEITPRVKSTQLKVESGWSDWTLWETTDDIINYKKRRDLFVINDGNETIYCLIISELAPNEDNIGNITRTFYCEYGEGKPCEIRIVYRTESKVKQLHIDLLDKRIRYLYIP